MSDVRKRAGRAALLAGVLLALVGYRGAAETTRADARNAAADTAVVEAPPVASLLATGKPGRNAWPHTDPGTTRVLPRVYPGAPPRIPHNPVDFAITRGDNDCLVCHLEGAEFSEGHVATRIPPSHFVNEQTGETRAATIVGIRYNCRQCHLPQAEGPAPEEAFAPGS